MNKRSFSIKRGFFFHFSHLASKPTLATEGKNKSLICVVVLNIIAG